MDAAQVKLSKKKDRTLVVIAGEMTITNVGRIRERLLQAFSAGKPVELSLAGLTAIDVTGLQVLCSCHRTSVAQGIPCTLTCPSDTVAAVAEAAGMPRFKGCAEDADGTCIWTGTEMVAA